MDAQLREHIGHPGVLLDGFETHESLHRIAAHSNRSMALQHQGIVGPDKFADGAHIFITGWGSILSGGDQPQGYDNLGQKAVGKGRMVIVSLGHFASLSLLSHYVITLRCHFLSFIVVVFPMEFEWK